MVTLRLNQIVTCHLSAVSRWWYSILRNNNFLFKMLVEPYKKSFSLFQLYLIFTIFLSGATTKNIFVVYMVTIFRFFSTALIEKRHSFSRMLNCSQVWRKFHDLFLWLIMILPKLSNYFSLFTISQVGGAL